MEQSETFEVAPVDNPALPVEVRRKIMEAQLAHDLKQMEWKQQRGEYERRRLQRHIDPPHWLAPAILAFGALAIAATILVDLLR